MRHLEGFYKGSITGSGTFLYEASIDFSTGFYRLPKKTPGGSLETEASKVVFFQGAKSLNPKP